MNSVISVFEMKHKLGYFLIERLCWFCALVCSFHLAYAGESIIFSSYKDGLYHNYGVSDIDLEKSPAWFPADGKFSPPINSLVEKTFENLKQKHGANAVCSLENISFFNVGRTKNIGPSSGLSNAGRDALVAKGKWVCIVDVSITTKNENRVDIKQDACVLLLDGTVARLVSRTKELP
ncbi:MAG TPA: hypothetical protein VGH19_17985 [Verrucomicrobiae bacterium]